MIETLNFKTLVFYPPLFPDNMKFRTKSVLSKWHHVTPLQYMPYIRKGLLLLLIFFNAYPPLAQVFPPQSIIIACKLIGITCVYEIYRSVTEFYKRWFI